MNPVLPLTLLIPILLAVVALGVWLSWKSSQTAPGKLRKILTGLRLLALLAMAVFLLNPGKWQSISDQVTRVWAVMLDSSKSMGVKEGESTRIEQALTLQKQIAQSAEDAGVELRYFTFDDAMTAVEAESPVTATGTHSDLTTSADSMLTQLSAQGEPLAGVLVLSDGRQTRQPRHSSFALRAQALQVPFHTVQVGGDVVMSDLALSAPRKLITAFPGQNVQITAVIESQGLDDLETPLILETETGEELQQVKVRVKADDRALHTFSIKAPEKSTIVRMRVPLDEDESRDSNNVVDVRLRILDDKAKVFIAEGAPYWDSKFLAQLLRQQKHMEVNSVHRLSANRWFRIDSGESKPHESANDVFPDTAEELMSYDLIIFGKNSEHFLTPSRIANLRAFVKDQGGAVLFSRSKPYTGKLPDLEPLEPVTWTTGLSGDFRLRPSADGQTAGLFGQALPAPESSVWSSLPELKDAHRIDVVKPFTRVLAHGEIGGGSTQGRFPLLMIRRYGQGVSGLVNADGLWKWDFYPDARELGNMYQEFWIQMIHWMLSYSEFLPGHDYSLNVSAGTVDPATPVAVRMAYRGVGKPTAPKLEVSSPVLDAPMILAPAAVPSADGRLKWATSFTPEKPGNYQLKLIPASRPEKGASLPEASVTVLPPPSEMDELSADAGFLKVFSESTGGQLLASADLPDFLSTALLPEARESRDQGVEWKSSWMRWFMPILVIVCLALEWWLRRRNGLV
ncbi:hypothetical protein JIN77_00710 [Verrucomicrobiaceae bacterium R5-34]|nr:hypothetical protein [Verrucomicrobiaceae bacterium R5-34]